MGFEALCAWFLRTDPEWSARVRKVWRWDDWPGRWGPDRGIDLVAELVGGELVAVQSKHYALSSTVTKADVDSFLSESAREAFAGRLLIATTQRLAAGAQQVIDAQEKPVTVILRDRLEEAHVDWAGFASTDAQPFERLAPKPHQREAVDAVVAGLRGAPRGQLLMPCGTGKTLTSMWIAEELGAERILVLVPRLVLLRQTVQVWRAQASEPFEALKVCSQTVGAGDEDDEVTAADLPLAHVGGPVTTDPDVIANFFRGPGRRVLFATYQSSPQVGRALRQLPGERLDLAICDEAHNCAGLEGGNFRTILSDQRIPVTRRLFVTATPTVFSSKAAQKAGSVGTAVASMDDQRKFGRVLHRLTFKEAVKRELLCPFQIVVMPVSDDDIAWLVERRRLVTVDGGDHVTDAFNLAAQIACLRTMAVYGCRRLVAFHPRVKASEEFTRDVRRAADLLDPRNRPDGFTAVHVDGYMTAPKRRQAMRLLSRSNVADHLGKSANDSGNVIGF